MKVKQDNTLHENSPVPAGGSNNLLKLVALLGGIVVIILVMIYFLFFKNNDKVRDKNNIIIEMPDQNIPNTSSNDELKKKEMELKEKELQLKEKELDQQKNSTNQPNTQRGNDQSGLPGRYPEASARYLTYSDVNNKSSWDLKIMRNEIFARHGYIFQTDEMRDYFNRQSWYESRYGDVNGMLSKIEKENIDLIKRYEK